MEKPAAREEGREHLLSTYCVLGNALGTWHMVHVSPVKWLWDPEK